MKQQIVLFTWKSMIYFFQISTKFMYAYPLALAAHLKYILQEYLSSLFQDMYLKSLPKLHFSSSQ